MLDGIFGALEEQQSRALVGGELPLSRSGVSGSVGLIEQQKRDGEVCRSEFNLDYGVERWPLLSDPDVRQKLETYVLRNCIPERHRYRLADGSQGVVYFDARGRAVSSRLTEMPDADLTRMAREAGKKVNGYKNNGKPKTGREDHGYRETVQEGRDLDQLTEGAGDPISIGIGKQMAIGRKQGVIERKRLTDPDALAARLDQLGEKASAEFSAAARSAEVLVHYGWGGSKTYSVLGMDKRTMLATKDLERELSAGFYMVGQIIGLRGKGEK